MMNDKLDELLKIYEEAAECTLCEKFNRRGSKGRLYDGLVNFFVDKNMYLNIPSIWTDWINRCDSKIMIVGQDWGPYIDMQKCNARYKKLLDSGEAEECAWKAIVNEKESMTKCLMTEFIIRSAAQYNINIDESIIESCFITNAVLCARKGENYRGTNNFSAKFCTENCTKKLNKQIDIIKPLVVITLGYWPFYSVCKHHKIPVYKTLKENISYYSLSKENRINISDKNNPVYVLPVYHPVAQVKKEEQISIYKIIWEILLQYYSKDELISELCTYRYHRKELNL